MRICMGINNVFLKSLTVVANGTNLPLQNYRRTRYLKNEQYTQSLVGANRAVIQTMDLLIA